VEVKVGPRFVHIVEDNATFRKTIEGRLKEFGYEVSTYPLAQHLLDRLPSDDVPSCILVPIGNLIRLAREAESRKASSHERSLQPGLVVAGVIVPVAGLVGS
jgi:FixJ family two-component response regulator